MPVAQDLVNDVLFQLREPGVNFGAFPTIAVGADYQYANILYVLNDGIRDFISKTGFTPSVSDKYVVVPVTAGMDFTLPANCLGLVRLEYAIGPSGVFQPLPSLSFDEFDMETGLQANANAQGSPRMYREPFGEPPNMVVRFNPAPTALSVTEGDKVALYYSASGGVLVNPTDTPGFAAEYHEALVAFALARLWLIKDDPSYAKYWLDIYAGYVTDARKRFFNVNQNRTFGFQDPDDSIDGIPGDDYLSG
jgi:hypothetical protein